MHCRHYSQRAQQLAALEQNSLPSPEILEIETRIAWLREQVAGGAAHYQPMIALEEQRLRDLTTSSTGPAASDWAVFEDTSLYWTLTPEEKRELLLRFVEAIVLGMRENRITVVDVRYR